MAFGPIERARRPATAENLASSTPASTSTGTSMAPSRSHSGSWVPVPARRRLEARPAAVLARRSSRAAAAGREPGEQGLGQPLVEEGGDADLLDVVGQRVVGRPAGGPLVVVVDAAGGADQHQPLHQVGAGEGEVEGEAPAHRVADVGGGPAGVAEQQRARRGGRPPRRSSRRGRGRRPAPARGRGRGRRRTSPQHRPVWVKPCTSTRRSACRRPGARARRPRRAAGPAAGSVTGRSVGPPTRARP